AMAARGGPSGTPGERIAAAMDAEAGPTDEALAEEGEELFQAKGCTACHKFGEGRLVGPDLVGVTERREKQWTVSMIMHPDSMVRVDSIARRLLSEYYTPMQNMGVTREE
ncbi:MAG: c-type cytochrome, partial [Gemmatimonadetes bacterium]|nr:cytochrome c [Gemmatimonadota bacterium]NIU37627.1 c-type cytochrome [Gemmatimonadota bacterium]NIW38201.1 c-type cytochrome [Gemmatimonadota bacterium]